MTATTEPRMAPQMGSPVMVEELAIPVAAATKILQGTMVAIDISGYAVAADDATSGYSGIVYGKAEATADNTNGAAGAIKVRVKRGTFKFVNSSGTGAITIADLGKLCFAVDNQTVTRLNSTSRMIAGKVMGVVSDGVFVETGVLDTDPQVVDLYLVAGADLSTTGRYLFVEENGSGKVTVQDNAGAICLGVLQNSPVADAIAIVRTHGPSLVVGGGTITALKPLKSTNAGKTATHTAITADASGASATAAISGSYVMGWAITAQASDTLGSMFIHPVAGIHGTFA